MPCQISLNSSRPASSLNLHHVQSSCTKIVILGVRMKTYNSANPTQICRKCGYNSNSKTSTHCQICNYPLNKGNILTTNLPAIPWSAVPLIMLLLLTLGFYFFWRDHAVPITASNPSPPITPLRSRPTSAKLSPASDLQLYDLMRDVPNVPKGLFNYGGATCFAAMTAHGMKHCYYPSSLTVSLALHRTTRRPSWL